MSKLLKHRLFRLLLLMATMLVSLAACDDDDNVVDEDEITCPFCGEPFDTEEECLNHQNTCDPYVSQTGDCIVSTNSDEYTQSNVDMAHWMSALPKDKLISELTIPGLHDAATYTYDGSFTPTYVKDQNLDYSDAWKMGARAFDLRIGYDARTFQGSFEDRCKFFHGDAFPGIVTGTCMMHNFSIDVTGHFPTKEQLKGEFMILIVKNEFHPQGAPKPEINTFEYLMRLLIERYGRDAFIAYSPDLTLGDCQGKIILFTREEMFTADYSYIGGVPSVPVTYISGFPDDGTTNLTVYKYGVKGSMYSAYVQDKYNIGSDGKTDDKYNAFINALNHRKEKAPKMLFFNGMNAVQDKPSWDVCEAMNKKVASDMSKSGQDLNGAYRQPLGIVLTDFYGVDKYDHGWLWSERSFSGDKIASALVCHNFRVY